MHATFSSTIVLMWDLFFILFTDAETVGPHIMTWDEFQALGPDDGAVVPAVEEVMDELLLPPEVDNWGEPLDEMSEEDADFDLLRCPFCSKLLS